MPKMNNNKSGAAVRDRERKRQEAEERNAVYSKLSLKDKLARQKEGGKVWKKLTAK